MTKKTAATEVGIYSGIAGIAFMVAKFCLWLGNITAGHQVNAFGASADATTLNADTINQWVTAFSTVAIPLLVMWFRSLSASKQASVKSKVEADAALAVTIANALAKALPGAIAAIFSDGVPAPKPVDPPVAEVAPTAKSFGQLCVKVDALHDVTSALVTDVAKIKTKVAA